MRFTPLTVPEVAVSSAAGSFDINSAVVFLSDRQRLYMVFVLFVCYQSSEKHTVHS